MDTNLRKKQFEDYFIYEDGTIVSLLTGKHITKRIDPRGYYQINLCINGKCKTFKLHRIIATAFIANPNNLPCVNHIDGNKLNNSLSNLEWVTYSDNTKHAVKTGLIHPAKGLDTNNGRFNETEIKKIRQLACTGMTYREIANLYSVSKGSIQQIVNRNTYKWVL